MKKLTAAVVLDENEGMMIFGKRQSRDRVLVADFVSSVGEKNVYVSPFSRVIFEPHQKVNIVDNPFVDAKDGGACFNECFPLAPYIDMIETLIVYRWNELYPSDVKLDINLEKAGFKLTAVSEFEGSSHERITKEVYVK